MQKFFSVIIILSVFLSSCQKDEMPARKTYKGIDCVYVPAGTFKIGCFDNEVGSALNEGGQHDVTLTKGFYISKFEITTSQFCAYLNETGLIPTQVDGLDSYYVKGQVEGYGEQTILVSCYNSLDYENGVWKPKAKLENHPIDKVSWYGAYEFCRWAGGTLPTEAQWEYACRGGQKKSLPFGIGDGQTLSSEIANCCTGGHYDIIKGDVLTAESWLGHSTSEVGYFKANGFGLYDMHGNVKEWCLDSFKSNPTYYNDNGIDPLNYDESGTISVLRGGGFLSRPSECRSARREAVGKDSYLQAGIRFVKVVK